ncbi:MAG: hypothetical protein LBR56_07710 [Sporomusaceae bacterium]|jgi:hypothetical protein|nr:hypothetical protein [Sporomusaceae bacterium]
MDPFDIYIAYVSWEGGGKRRPVLFLAQEGSYVEIFRITSQYTDKSAILKMRYFEITDWRQAGLTKLSYIDTTVSLEIPAALISEPPIGKLTENDKRRLIGFLNRD